ncbi:MAG: hypothetical protein LBT09_10425, partial [Planctomycetaceae bacterium]|nr:hypothetical protein [Planctomycetaceae bacterium]
MKHSRRHFIQHIIQSGIGIGALSAAGTSHASEVSFVPAPEKVSAKLPVFGEADICVLGGSCTGV